ncbi:MAG TPA: DUF5691 domain-containing protein [Puia sp.]|nr:DUF5691 domain-containing protein [Puia sp.]
MQFWEEIINTALLGTDKRAVTAAQLPEGLAGAAERIVVGAADKEEQFLQLAAVAVNYRQSGIVPLQQEGVGLAMAPPEELPYCSGRSMQVLKEILEEGNDRLLEFWLKLCVKKRQVVMPEVLPVLLNKAVNHGWMQQLMVDAGGKRREWIRGFNVNWRIAAELPDDEAWQTGTATQRTDVLRRWRRDDPEKARVMVAQTWAQENANGKVALLQQLSGTVSNEDVAWLEGLLTEKSQKVKEEVLVLLSAVAGSSVVERNWETVRAGVVLKKERALLGMVNKTSLLVDLKDTILLANVPPVYWETYLGAEPATIVGYFQKDHKKLLETLAAAIWKFRDARWAEALAAADDGFYPAIAPLLPKGKKEGYWLREISASSIMQLSEWEEEWGLEITRAVLKYTARLPYQYAANFYKEQVVRMPAGITPELEKFAPTEPHLKVMWDKLSEQIKRLLGLKEQVSKAFN